MLTPDKALDRLDHLLGLAKKAGADKADAVYFGETQPTDSKAKAAYRELRLWQKGYLAAVAGGRDDPCLFADEFVLDVNAKRSQLLA